MGTSIVFYDVPICMISKQDIYKCLDTLIHAVELLMNSNTDKLLHTFIHRLNIALRPISSLW